MIISTITSKGGRSYNQDYAAYETKSGFVIIAVADGLGAYSGSEIASETAVKTVLSRFESYVGRGDDPINPNFVCKFFKSAHNAIARQKASSPELHSVCTTLSVVVADKTRFIAAHVGDSRIYFFRNGTLNFYSKDHSLARAAVERGEITAAEIRGHEDQNKLTRVLGSDAFSAPDYKICTDYTEGDAILICTDGFWEYVYEYEMERVLRSTDGANPALKKMEELLLARAPEGNDNYTATLLRFADPCRAPSEENAPTPTKSKTRNTVKEARNV